MRLPTRSVVTVLAATTLIAACGSDGDGVGSAGETISPSTVTESTVTATTVADTTPDTTEPATDDTTTTEAPDQDVDADTAAAEAALLTLVDFPEGWTQTADEGTGNIEDRLAECIGVDSLTSADASATSGTFTNPDGTLVVSETVAVTATERDARFVMASITNPDVPDCLAAAYDELGADALGAGAVAEGATLGSATATRLAVGAAGDATQAIRVQIPVTDGSSTVTVDHVIARSGRSIAALTFEGRSEPTAVETIDAITEPAASRLPA